MIRLTTTTTLWTVDPAHSSAEFSIRHLMITSVKGHFTGIAGMVRGNPEDLSNAEVQLTIDVATVDTRQAERDQHLRSGDFFHADEYPTMTFVSKSIRPKEAGLYEVTGDLTIRGVTKEVTAQVTFDGIAKDPWGGTRAGFTATTRINRRDFGLHWNVALEAGGVLVGDEVKVSVELETVLQD